MEKGDKNVIFHSLVGVKRERKENRVDRIFHPGPPFFFSSIGGEKMRENGIEKKNTYLPPLFHSSTFNNKNVIIIYSFILPFSILSTKHT